MYGLSPLALSHERSGLCVEAPAPSFIAKPVKIQTPMSACDPNSIKKIHYPESSCQGNINMYRSKGEVFDPFSLRTGINCAHFGMRVAKVFEGV